MVKTMDYKPISTKAIQDATKYIRKQKEVILGWKLTAYLTTLGWIGTLVVLCLKQM